MTRPIKRLLILTIAALIVWSIAWLVIRHTLYIRPAVADLRAQFDAGTYDESFTRLGPAIMSYNITPHAGTAPPAYNSGIHFSNQELFIPPLIMAAITVLTVAFMAWFIPRHQRRRQQRSGSAA